MDPCVPRGTHISSARATSRRAMRGLRLFVLLAAKDLPARKGRAPHHERKSCRENSAVLPVGARYTLFRDGRARRLRHRGGCMASRQPLSSPAYVALPRHRAAVLPLLVVSAGLSAICSSAVLPAVATSRLRAARAL